MRFSQSQNLGREIDDFLSFLVDVQDESVVRKYMPSPVPVFLRVMAWVQR